MSYLDQLISEYEQDGWIAGTQQWCKDMVDEVRVLQSLLEELNRKVAALQQENASLQQDAARYRWLRTALADRDKGVSHHFCSVRCSEELDASIDTAMQANK